MFKENPAHAVVQLNVYVPMNAGISKVEMMRSIMNAIEVQVMLDLKEAGRSPVRMTKE